MLCYEKISINTWSISSSLASSTIPAVILSYVIYPAIIMIILITTLVPSLSKNSVCNMFYLNTMI